MTHGRAPRLALLALTLVFCGAVDARAADYYAVQDGSGVTCASGDPCRLDNALQKANATGGTVHVIGALTWTTSSLDVGGAGGAVILQGTGSGSGGTFIDVSQPQAMTISYGSTVDAVRIRNSGGVGVDLGFGSSLTDSSVQTTSDNVGVAVANLTGASSSGIASLQRDSVSTPDAATDSAVDVASNTGTQSLQVLDSTLVGKSGINDYPHTAPIDVQRSTIEASDRGILVDAPTAYLSSSVIRMHGSGSAFELAGNSGANAYLTDDTLDGADSDPGSNGYGVWANTSPVPTDNVISLTGSIVRGFHDDLRTEPTLVGIYNGGVIDVARSDYSTKDNGGTAHPGTINDLGGNVVGVDPRFVNRSAGDYRLRFDSPLIDAAGGGAIDTAHHESATDRVGSNRILDGNQSGTAERDMGAFEYLFSRPAASFNVTPNPATAGQLVTFDASGTTYSNGPIVDYRWDLDGDGSFETDSGPSPRVTRSYAGAAAPNVQLVATGVDGASSQTARTLVVRAAPPASQPVTGAALAAAIAHAVRLLGGTLTIVPPGVVKVPAACDAVAPGDCPIAVVIRSNGPVRARVAAARTRKKKGKVLTLGRGSATIARGKHGSVKVKLSKKALTLVRTHKLSTVRATATVSGASAATAGSKTYKLKLARAKRKKRH